MKKQIILDIETTGINLIDKHYIGHKIIEIGAIEIINRQITNNFLHFYLNPNRKIDHKAYQIHGIKNSFLLNKPIFKYISNNLINFIKNSDLIIHNSYFDIGFIENELKLIKHKITKIKNICNIIDTLSMARKNFPGKKNDLNSLCQRFNIDNSLRKKHGALIDAKLLALVYLNMTRKQIKINFNSINKIYNKKNTKNLNKKKIIIRYANKKEIQKHLKNKKYINNIYKKSKKYKI